jgi:formylglycine-generating enzyme required for sulfatase activity
MTRGAALMADIFIGYAKKDKKKAEQLAQVLEAQGWSVWWDVYIPAGKTFDEVIEEALVQARCIVVLWSKTSVAKHWVKTEAEEGRQRNVLVPVRLDDVAIPLAFKRIQAAPLIGWQGEQSHPGVERLLQDIAAVVGPPPVQKPTFPNHPVEPAVPEGMVLVPRGPFLFGDDKRLVTIDYDYLIGIYPVTNEQYQRFIAAGGYMIRGHWSGAGWNWKGRATQPAYWGDTKWNQPAYPVVGVSYYEAEAYASWAGMWLPTMVEWQKAARGTAGHKYPWGNEFDKEKCNSAESRIGRTTPVMKYMNGVSPFGCYDMAGNVWEWTSSDGDEGCKVVQGGSWENDADSVHVTVYGDTVPDERDNNLGFRCAKTP